MSAFTVRLPEDLHHDVKLHAMYTNESAQHLVTRLVADYMDKQGRAAIGAGIDERSLSEYHEAFKRLAQ